MVPIRLRAAAATVCALLSLVACAWSVPADPGRNAQGRARPRAAPGATPAPSAGASPTTSDAGMPSFYVTRCGRCHEPYAPTHAFAAEWPGIVRRMAPRAGVFGADRARLLAWLEESSR